MSYIGNQPADIGVYAVQAETGNGVLTAFTLDRAATTASISISIDGVDQIPTTAYAVTVGTTLTFTSPPPNLSVISIRFLGDTVSFGEPSDDAVATVKIQDDAVTAAKLANSINTEIAANTAKVTNATHTGDVTGATALTIATDAVDIAMLSATGTADSTTFLRGDNAWATAGGDNTPSFFALLPTNFTSTYATYQKLPLTNELWDTNSAYDSTTNYRFTVPSGEAGKYSFTWHIVTNDCALSSDMVHGVLYLNGAIQIPTGGTVVSGGAQQVRYTTTSYLSLSVADYVELYVYTTSNNTQNFLGGTTAGSPQCWFMSFKLIGV